MLPRLHPLLALYTSTGWKNALNFQLVAKTLNFNVVICTAFPYLRNVMEFANVKMEVTRETAPVSLLSFHVQDALYFSHFLWLILT